MNRRQFIKAGSLLGAYCTTSFFPQKSVAAAQRTLTDSPQRWVSAQKNSSNKYALGWVNVANGNTHKHLTSFRGHDVIHHQVKNNTALMFARRPGIEAVEIQLDTGKMSSAFTCKKNRHLFGHGCINHSISNQSTSDQNESNLNESILFTTESDLENGLGKIGVRDANNYQLLDEFDSYGIGPHQIKLLPDGKTLVVANGGIHTHPSTGRKKLNLDTMDSSLTYIDAQSGKLIDQFRIEESKASIRHLDVSANGKVAFAIQVQREACQHSRAIPLTGIHAPGKPLELFNTPKTLLTGMNDYVGSVAINSESQIAGFTCPKGNVAAFWDMNSKSLVDYHRLHDVCGIAVTPDQQHFVLSSSTGEMRALNAKSLQEDRQQRIKIKGAHWDNHLMAIKQNNTEG